MTELDELPFDQGSSGGRYRSNDPMPSQVHPSQYDTGPMARVLYPPPAQVQQQQSANNMVVVGNQPTPSPHVVRIRNAEDHLVITVILFVCCLLLGNTPVMLCLFPALIFSCIASKYNEAGQTDLAKMFGSLACQCNIAAIIPTICMLVTAAILIIIVILMFVGVIATSNESS